MSEQIEKVVAYFEGVQKRKPELALQWLDATAFVEHDPAIGSAVDGVKAFVGQLGVGDHQRLVRVFEDGHYVFTQADGSMKGLGTFFDVFRFEAGRIVEHWRFAAEAAPPNKSGHTQVDGPTQARNLDETQGNKAFLRDYYETFHLQGNYENSQRYFIEGRMARHEPGVSDGVQEFLSDVQILMQHRTIDTIKLLLGQGDFVFLVAEGTHEKKPCLYVDLYRIEDRKIVEHWGFPQMVPPMMSAKNENGML